MSKDQDIYLFRIKFIKEKQSILEFNPMSPKEILVASIKEKPSVGKWHIGNVELIDEAQGHFKVGKDEVSDLSKYDDESKDFVEESAETGPNTIIYFYAELGLLGIASKYTLCANVEGLANTIKQLLKSTKTARDMAITVEIGSIKDPMQFLEYINKAHRIKNFSVTFTGPNPFDADESFHKPMSIYLREANGEKGTTAINGTCLNAGVVAQVTRSIASTGDNATAKIQNHKGDKLILIRLEGNIAKITVEQTSLENDRLILQEIREKYNEIRKDENN